MKYFMGSLSSVYSQKEVTHIGQFITTLWTNCIDAMNSTKQELIVNALSDCSLMLSLMYRVFEMVKQNFKTLQTETSKHSEVVYLQGAQFCKNSAKASMEKVVSLSNRQKKKMAKLAAKQAFHKKPTLVPNVTGKVKEESNNVLQPFVKADESIVEDIADLTMMQRWMRGY